ncbi:AAA family ATPase, partial [Halomonas sp. BBD48]|nr:AAA family ATPase [Halomonas sp. BBD48]
MQMLALYSIKGGVGKTASAVNLAAEAALAGKRVLLWDLDPQAATTFYLKSKAKVRGGVDKLVKG